MELIKTLVAVTAVAVLGVSTANANLLTNGSFEDTTNFNGCSNQGGGCPDDTMTLASGSTLMTGWTTTGSYALVAWIGPNNPFGLQASQGSYFLDLTGYQDAPPYAGVEQSVSTTNGAMYQLSFDLGASIIYGATVSIQACAGTDCQVFTETTALTSQWFHETLDFKALAGSTAIALSGYDNGNPTKYIGLDNVSLVPIPEPVTLSLLGSGLLAAGWFGRRRKSTS